MAGDRPDLILVGGGLANGLIAWRLAQVRPDIRFLIVEAGDRLGGNHTWSFHDHDLFPDEHRWIAELVAHRWPGYDVVFPGLERRLGSGYSSVTSDQFHRQLMHVLGDRVRLERSVAQVGPTFVRLASGEVLQCAAAVDGRGPRRSRTMALGFQKFLGQELLTEEPHGLVVPTIMDASVSQDEGYRFVYVLPLAADRLLVEDTYYADGAALDDDTLRTRIAIYAQARRWRVREVLREERGVLPIVLSGDIAGFWAEAAGMPRSGLAAGLFHPTTGYSLPDAVRLAEIIATMRDLSAPALHSAIRGHSVRLWRERRFYRLLNRMLFLAGPAQERHKVMRRFYGLPEPLIRRFYAGRTTAADKLRILSGKPPVPVLQAMKAAAAVNLHRRAA
jgi:lycopene beta-cyclase